MRTRVGPHRPGLKSWAQCRKSLRKYARRTESMVGSLNERNRRGPIGPRRLIRGSCLVVSLLGSDVVPGAGDCFALVDVDPDAAIRADEGVRVEGESREIVLVALAGEDE